MPSTQPSMAVGGSDSDNIFRSKNDIFFACDITHTSAHKLIKLLKEIENEYVQFSIDSKVDEIAYEKKYPTLSVSFKPKPILLHLTTYGGIIHAAFAIIDVIQSLKIPVHTIVNGYTASAGTLVSIAGEKRFISKNSFMMVHELRGGFWGKHSEMREQGCNLTKMMNHIILFYEKHSNGKLKSDVLTDILSRDRDWDASECLENGLVDEII